MNVSDYEDYQSLQNETQELKQELYEIQRECDMICRENSDLRHHIRKMEDYLSNLDEQFLQNIDFNIIESYVRKTKLNRINEK